MRVKAIIGANYGDEGKGLATDYLTGPDSLVVRFNGGAQAGHTVCTPSGQRHVFSHIGAGSFRGKQLRAVQLWLFELHVPADTWLRNRWFHGSGVFG